MILILPEQAELLHRSLADGSGFSERMAGILPLEIDLSAPAFHQPGNITNREFSTMTLE